MKRLSSRNLHVLILSCVLFLPNTVFSTPPHAMLIVNGGMEMGAAFNKDWYSEYYSWYYFGASVDAHAGSGIFLTGGGRYVPTGVFWNNSGYIIDLGADIAFSTSRDYETFYCLSGRARKNSVSFSVIALDDPTGPYDMYSDVLHKGHVKDTQAMFGLSIRHYFDRDPNYLMRFYGLFVYNFQDVEDTHQLRTGTSPDTYGPATIDTHTDNSLGFITGMEFRGAHIFFDFYLGVYHSMFMLNVAAGLFL